MGQLNNLNIGLEPFVLIFLTDIYSSLNTDFNCCNSFTLSSADKVTAGTWRFVWVIGNVVSWFAAALDITQHAYLDQMILVLINSISIVLLELFKYSNGTIILTAFVSLYSLEPVKFKRNTITGKLSIASALIKGSLSL